LIKLMKAHQLRVERWAVSKEVGRSGVSVSSEPGSFIRSQLKGGRGFSLIPKLASSPPVEVMRWAGARQPVGRRAVMSSELLHIHTAASGGARVSRWISKLVSKATSWEG
jgi:hypothetical protein